MGRHLERTHSGVQFQESHPGCMWGILHILDYHHWSNVKKMLPHKKHKGGRHARCEISPKTNLNKHDIEAHKIMDSEGEPLLVEQHNRKTSPANTNKRSGKAHIKELTAKEMSKEEHKYWNLSYAARTWLRRIIPIHHLEHSDNSPGEIPTVRTNPIILLQKCADTSATGLPYSSLPVTPEELVTCDKKCTVCGDMNDVDYLRHKQSVVKQGQETLLNQNLIESNQLNREISNNQFKECFDVLEIFKVHNESFPKILQDPNVGMKHFQSLQNSDTEARLMKSGSFPVANASRAKNIRPRTLEHKQNESWSFPKREKLLASSLASEFGASKSQKEYHLKSMPFMANNNCVGSATRQETNFYSSYSSRGVSHQGWNQQVINRFKEIKQKIWNVLKENKKESSHTSMEAVHERDPSGKEISERSEIFMSQDGKEDSGICHEANSSEYGLSRGRLDSMRRTSSLNESLDRYTGLFERTFGRETKWHHSKSLKLTNEGKVPSSGCAPKSFRRRLSLPDFDSFYSSLNDASSDALSSEIPLRTAVDCCTIIESDNRSEPKSVSTLVEGQIPQPINATLETEFQKDMIEGSDGGWNIHSSSDLIVGGNYEGISETGDLCELAFGKSGLHQEEIIGLTMNPSKELAQGAAPGPVSDLEICFPDDTNSRVELPIDEGPGSNTRDTQMDEPDAYVDQQTRSSTDSSPAFCSTVTPENTEETNMSIENQILHFNLDESDDADFNYVRVVLDMSGFIKNQYLGTWYSLEQPLSPLLFKELEACLYPELEDCAEEVDGSCDHQLLFDLINDTLLEIYERSFTYFPRAFSFNHHIRPVPKGHHLLEEVWAKISSYLSLRPELDQSLEDVVARDLAKGDVWLNLQFDNECVALELEDLILEELLDELICS